MLHLFKHFAQKWADWCGDRDMENAIRAHLTNEGYYGGTAKLKNVRLVAVQRPGWVQVYRFEVTARRAVMASEDQPDPMPIDDQLFGLVRDDGRKGSTIRTFSDDAQRRELFARWSEGMLRLRGAHGLAAPN